jgi:hypothetical protein
VYASSFCLVKSTFNRVDNVDGGTEDGAIAYKKVVLSRSAHRTPMPTTRV